MVNALATWLFAAAFVGDVSAQRATPEFRDISGTFILRGVNGRVVDIVGQITAGRLDIRPDGSWDMRINWRGDLGWARVFGDHGTLLLHGTDLTFVSSENGDTLARVQTGTIDMEYTWPVDSKAGRYVLVRQTLRENPRVAHAPSAAPGSSAALQWATISASVYQSYGVTSDGAGYCWGLRAQPSGSPGGDRPLRVSTDVTFSTIAVANATVEEGHEASRPRRTAKRH